MVNAAPVTVVPITAVPTQALKYILKILRVLPNLEYARVLADKMHLYLHPHLQCKINALAILHVIRLAFDASQGAKICLCCLSQSILLAAHLNTAVKKDYCCAPGPFMSELCTTCQFNKTVERLEAQAAADARRPRARPASLYSYDSSASSDDAAQGGRVSRRRAAAARTPYARPAARRGVPPRTEYDYMLPPRIVDVLADSLAACEPFAVPRDPVGVEALVARLGDYQPFAEPTVEVTARACNYQPFVPVPEPVAVPAPVPAVVQPEYTVDDLTEDLAGHHIPADEPVRGGDDDELSAVIGRFARQTLQAPPAPTPTWPSLRSEYYGRAN